LLPFPFMKRQLTALLAITGALALACSKDKPAQSAYDETERPADETPLTPASSNSVERNSLDHSQPRSSESGSATVNPPGDPLLNDAPDTIPPREPTKTTTPNDSSATAPDNTARNERDRSSSAVTPMDQGQGQSDLDITQKIRQAVMKDSSLSFTSKNVKIITKDGKVTLRGTVPSYEERLAIEDAARKVAGAPNVESEIEVKK
jgi:hyperosmotically inducible periplasmic protein